MRIALFGWQGAGKTTLAGLLSGRVQESYDPLRPALASGRAGDPRLERLAAVCPSRKTAGPELTLLDFRGVAPGSPWDPRLFPRLAEADAILLVAAAYRPGDRPENALESLFLELVFHDYQRVSELVAKRREELGGGRRKPDPAVDSLLAEALGTLENERPASGLAAGARAREFLASLGLATARPLAGLVNGPGGEAAGPAAVPVFRADLDPGQAAGDLPGLWRGVFSAAGFLTFYTLGEKENRGWLLPRGETALEAAGCVHTDIARGFIRAEVIAADDLLAAGSRAACRAGGQLRLEGRDYVVADGDIIHVHSSA